MEQLLRHIAFLGCGLALLLGIGQLVIEKKDLRNWAFAGFFMSLSSVQFAGYNAQAGNLVYLIPGFSFIDLPLLFCVGPFLLIVFLMTMNDQANRNKMLLHFAAPLLVLFLLIPHYMQPAAEKAMQAHQVFIQKQLFLPDYLYMLGVFHVIGYVLYMVFKLRFVYRDAKERQQPGAVIVTLLVSFAAVVMLSAFAAMLSRDYIFFRISCALITLSISVMFLLGYRNPQFFKSFITIVHDAQYKQSHLESLDLQKLGEDLSYLMQHEKAYLEDICLARLSERLQVTPHQLSEFINGHLNQNFSSYINQLRIEEAKRLMLTEPERNISSIIYRVGFNSSSAFHRAFTRSAGVSPGKFKAAALNAQKN